MSSIIKHWNHALKFTFLTVFREEYMPKLDKARREIEKRVAGLEERKTQVRILCF